MDAAVSTVERLRGSSSTRPDLSAARNSVAKKLEAHTLADVSARGSPLRRSYSAMNSALRRLGTRSKRPPVRGGTPAWWSGSRSRARFGAAEGVYQGHGSTAAGTGLARSGRRQATGTLFTQSTLEGEPQGNKTANHVSALGIWKKDLPCSAVKRYQRSHVALPRQ